MGLAFFVSRASGGEGGVISVTSTLYSYKLSRREWKRREAKMERPEGRGEGRPRRGGKPHHDRDRGSSVGEGRERKRAEKRIFLGEERREKGMTKIGRKSVKN